MPSSTYPLGAVRVLAIVLVVAGIAGLAYRGFTYTRDSSTTTLGPIELTVKDERRVNIPIWAGVIALAAGVVLLVAPVKK